MGLRESAPQSARAPLHRLREARGKTQFLGRPNWGIAASLGSSTRGAPRPTHQRAGRLVAEALCALRQGRACRPPANPLRARPLAGPPGSVPVPPPQGPCTAPCPEPPSEEPPQAKIRVVSGSGFCPSLPPSSGLTSLRQPLVWPWAGKEERRGGGAWAGGAEEEGPGLGAPEGRGGKTAGRGGREGSEARRREPAALSLAVNKLLHSNGLCARLRARLSGCLVGGSRASLALAGGVVEPCGRRTAKSPPGRAGQPPRCWGLRARHRAGQAGGRTLDSRPAVGVPGRPALTARRAGWGYRPRDICGRCVFTEI